MSLRRFDGSNFNFLKEQMQDYLIVKGQIDPIENEVAPEIYKANEWQKLDRIIRATIRMHLSESVYFTVQSCETTLELWKKLSETYEKKVASKYNHGSRCWFGCVSMILPQVHLRKPCYDFSFL